MRFPGPPLHWTQNSGLRPLGFSRSNIEVFSMQLLQDQWICNSSNRKALHPKGTTIFPKPKTDINIQYVDLTMILQDQ